MRQTILILLFISLTQGCSDQPAARVARNSPRDADVARTASAKIENSGSKIEPVALFYGPMPTGVAVSKEGRIFVNFPRWGDPVEITVAEIIDGKPVAFPDADINKLDLDNQADHLISVQSVVIDPQNRLWILDTGSINMGPIKSGGPKLFCVDLVQNKIVRRIDFTDTVALSTTYLNDVRFDMSRGAVGTAFITDSSVKGPNAIIVVDLASGHSWRRLNQNPSTQADANFIPSVEGKPLMVREPGKPEQAMTIGSDGIAIDPTKGVLYFCPLASRRLYMVSLDALVDPMLEDKDVAESVRLIATRDFASDGLECDRDGTLYLTDYEHNAIRKLGKDGQFETLASDERMIWPDSMSIGPAGQLYVIANQLNRQPRFHEGQDLRQKPYVLFRTPTGASRMASR